jgi:hypothetical protein
MKANGSMIPSSRLNQQLEGTTLRISKEVNPEKRRSFEYKQKNHIEVQSRRVLVDTFNRLIENDDGLVSVSFGYDICPFLLRDDFIDTMVEILRSSSHIKNIEFYIGRKCKSLSMKGTIVLGEYIGTSSVLNSISLEGDESVTERANQLIKAAAENSQIKDISLSSIRIQPSSLRAVSWERVSVFDCAIVTEEKNGTEFSSDDDDDIALNLNVLKLSRMCAPSLVKWILPRLKNPKELDITLDTFPLSMVPVLVNILSTTSSLTLFNFNIRFTSDSPIQPCRSLYNAISVLEEKYHDASNQQLKKVIKSLANNTTLNYLSLSLPNVFYFPDNDQTVLESLKDHVQNNLNLVEIGDLSCPGITSSKLEELEAIHSRNALFLKQVESGADDCPPALWPHLIERCLKSRCNRGKDVVFQRFADQRITLC